MRAKINTQYTKRSLSQIGITINMISTDVDDTCIVMGSPNLFPILLCKYRILPCLAVYNTCKKSGRGRSLRPLFSRALYIHNTRQTGQYLIYTMVTMYKASTVQFCARLCQNCETTEDLLYQNCLVGVMGIPYSQKLLRE